MPDRYNPREVERQQAQARAELAAERLAKAHLTRSAIANCQLCDADGYRGTNVCDHVDHAEAARKGRQACMAALAKDGDQ